MAKCDVKFCIPQSQRFKVHVPNCFHHSRHGCIFAEPLVRDNCILRRNNVKLCISLVRMTRISGWMYILYMFLARVLNFGGMSWGGL